MLLAMLTAASGVSACVSVEAPVRERVVVGEWVPGHWVETENGRRWIEGHYARVRPAVAPDARP